MKMHELKISFREKFISSSVFVIILLIWQNSLAAEITRHKADVCVYGGTASGVMAALAAKKEGAEVIIIEPTRYLGGMTGGGIDHLDWGKGNHPDVRKEMEKILIDSE